MHIFKTEELFYLGHSCKACQIVRKRRLFSHAFLQYMPNSAQTAPTTLPEVAHYSLIKVSHQGEPDSIPLLPLHLVNCSLYDCRAIPNISPKSAHNC